MAVSRIEEQQRWTNLSPKTRRGFNAMKENLTVIDGIAYNQNGKDVSHLVDIVPKYTEKQTEGFRNKNNLSNHHEANGGFVFAFFEELKTMEQKFPTLSQSDLARVIFVGTYAGWETGELKHDNGVSINKKALTELVGMSRNKFNTFFKSIVDCEIIAEQDGAIFMNQTLFFRGELNDGIKHLTKDLQYTRLYRKTVRDLYAMYNGRTIKQLALIYAVLPFVNFDSNVICFNPSESNKELVKPIPLDKLAVLLGYADYRKLKTALNAVKYEGQPVFGFFESGNDRRKKKTVVNPRVIYAGDGKSLEGIRVLFN